MKETQSQALGPRLNSRGVVIILSVLFVGIQFDRPDLTNETGKTDLKVPAPVQQILRTSCYNCHSNETKLSWFDHIVPAYWFVVEDIRKARSHLNFSELSSLPQMQQQEALYEMVNQIQSGDMPPRKYELFHREARITPEQLAILRSALNPYRQRATADPEQVAAADAEYSQWLNADIPVGPVPPAPNGIAFMPDYKNWKTISATDRLDNETIRLVLGNDTAIKAIQANQINPWPNGTIFAKVAWNRLVDPNGMTRPGKFWQVEFMIKDSSKYQSTLGWGFARWRGVGLQPFGKDATFAAGCVGCHSPMRDNDYVFTRPIKGA